MEAIVFEEVYPLHGSCDIQGQQAWRAMKRCRPTSSNTSPWRAGCCAKPSEYQALPILDELKFYVTKNLRRLRQGIISGDEVSIYDSLRTQVEPLFEYLAQNITELRPTIAHYWQHIDPRLGILYNRRKRL